MTQGQAGRMVLEKQPAAFRDQLAYVRPLMSGNPAFGIRKGSPRGLITHGPEIEALELSGALAQGSGAD